VLTALLKFNLQTNLGSSTSSDHWHIGKKNLFSTIKNINNAFSALMLFIWRQEKHLACKKTEWWDVGMVICLRWDADLHMPSWCHCHSLSLAPVNPDWFTSWFYLSGTGLPG